MTGLSLLPFLLAASVPVADIVHAFGGVHRGPGRIRVGVGGTVGGAAGIAGARHNAGHAAGIAAGANFGRRGVLSPATALAALADVDDTNDDNGDGSKGSNTDDNPTPQPPQQQLPETQPVQSWLLTHLPALPPADLQAYASQLYHDGFASPAQLNDLNSGKSGRVEDLYFMKKGHRRVLMKKLGAVRGMRGREGNRLIREEGSGQNGARPPETKDGPPAAPTGEKERGLDTSIEEWLEEQNRLVEERRLARLAEEKKLRGDKARRVDKLRGAFGAESRTREAVVAESVPEDAVDDEMEELQPEEQSKVDVASPAEHFRQKTKQRLSSGEDRSLDELKREFAGEVSAAASSVREFDDDEKEWTDDLTARYQSLDLRQRGRNDGDKEERRLEELRGAFLDAKRNAGTQLGEEDPVDDLTARYQSLDKDTLEDGGAARDKESRRLEELKQAFLSAKRNNAGQLEDEDPLDDLAARYQSLDKDALEDGSTRNKQSRRLEEMKRAFLNARRNVGKLEEEDPLDDLAARYQSLDKDTLEDGSARNKQSRRLEEMKREFLRKAAAARTLDEGEAPLDDVTARYRSMDASSLEDGSARDKGSRRLEEIKRAFRNAKKRKLKEEEEEEPLRLDLLERRETVDKKGLKTNEARRLEELERHFNERRAARMAEEERLEQLLLEAKLAASLDDAVEEKSEGRARGPPSVREVWEAYGNMELDDFFAERPAAGRSLSTTLPPTNAGKKRGDKKATSAEKEAAAADMNLDEYTDITVNNIRERENQSLATTMPPSNRGAKIARRSSDTEGGGEKNGSEASSPNADLQEEDDKKGSIGPSADKKAMVPDDTNLDEYTDITKNNIRGRESLSLSTTMPPSNRGVPAARRSVEIGADEEEEESEECIGDECWDITRSAFPERTSKSLATTLPPANKPAKGVAPLDETAIENDGGDEEGDDIFDITQNLFPEGQPSARSAFGDGEKSEMNARPPNASSPKRKPVRSDGTAKSSSNPNEEGSAETNSRASALYQRFRSGDQSSFSSGERSEMNSRPPPPVSGRSAPQWSQRPDDGDDVLDVHTQFPRDRPSTSVNTGTKKSRVTTSGSYEESKRQPNAPAQNEDDSPLDIMMNFPEERPSVSVNTGTKRDQVTTSGSYQESKERPKDVAEGEVDDSYMDIMMNFPKDRPSMSVNTGTLKDRITTSGSYEESKSRDGMAARILANFPKERPSVSVNTGTNKSHTTTGSYRESKKRLDEASRNEEDAFVDITQTQGHFSRNRPSSWVNTGTKRRDTASGTQEESYRNIAHNFSTDRASLLGLPKRKMVDNTPKRVAGDSKFLDVHQFSGQLSRGSQARAIASTAKWRDSSAAKKDEKYLDTPPAFSHNLDMMLSSAAKGATKGRARAAQSSGQDPTNSHLDKNPFSSDVRHSGTATRDLKKGSAVSDQPFLDTPRVFRSGVDMVSSNTSGKRFKRSSDVPPEEKNVRDHYDITTEPMPDRIASSRTSRTSLSAAERPGEEPYTDITRAPMSRLERTSSIVKDANSASKTGSKDTPPESATKPKNGNNDGSNGVLSEESSFDQVMWWLLSHIPQLQEEDAITYFHILLEEGFDSLDNLEELAREDLHFMKSDHREALLRSVRSKSAKESDADDTEGANGGPGSVGKALDDTFDDIKEELEKTEAWIAEQNRLVEERFAARLAEEREETQASQMEDGASARGSSPAKANKVDAENEPFEDITHSSFVDRPSLSLAAPDSSFTRDSFPDRPSSSTLSSYLTDGNKPSSSKRLVKGTDDKAEVDDFFDITRDSFQEDRPSSILAASSDPESTTDAPAPSQNSYDIAPRAELYQHYIKKGFNNEEAQRLKDYFTVWADDAKSHESKFTCIFTCPMTGEHFAAGRWKSVDDGVEAKDQLFWYKNKKQAMNAAAAQALDCFSLRECHGTEKTPARRCDDEPYLSNNGGPNLATLPLALPSELVRPDNSL